jgi:hypothetical protein
MMEGVKEVVRVYMKVKDMKAWEVIWMGYIEGTEKKAEGWNPLPIKEETRICKHIIILQRT